MKWNKSVTTEQIRALFPGVIEIANMAKGVGGEGNPKAVKIVARRSKVIGMNQLDKLSRLMGTKNISVCFEDGRPLQDGSIPEESAHLAIWVLPMDNNRRKR